WVAARSAAAVILVGGSGPLPGDRVVVIVSWLMVRVMRPTSPVPGGPSRQEDSGGGSPRVRRRMRLTAMAWPAGLVMMTRHGTAGSVSAAWARWRAWPAVMGADAAQ